MDIEIFLNNEEMVKKPSGRFWMSSKEISNRQKSCEALMNARKKGGFPWRIPKPEVPRLFLTRYSPPT
jgi:hypothetical protein